MILLITIALFLLTSLFGAVEATYQARPALNFQKFNDIYQQRYGGVGGNPFPGKLATHIGTFTVNTGGATVRNFALNSTHDNNFYFSGPRSTGTGTFGFVAASVVKYGNKLYGTKLYYPPRHPIQPTNFPMTGTIVIDFYLISWEDDIFFVEDGTYTHTSGKMPPFSVTFSTSQSDFWSASFDPMSVNGGTPGQSLPYLHNGSDTFPDEEIPYGDPPELVNYTFTIINKKSLNLPDAYGDNKGEVATAQLTLSNGDPNKNYGVTVIFTNQTNTNPFRMVIPDLPNSPSIPYRLYFKNKVVTPGGLNSWDGLSNGVYTETIRVTQVNQTTTEVLPPDTYRDTIVVTIIPNDTV